VLIRVGMSKAGQKVAATHLECDLHGCGSEAMRLDSGSKVINADEVVWVFSCAETSRDRRRLEGVVLCGCCVVLWIERWRRDAHSGKGQNGQCVTKANHAPRKAPRKRQPLQVITPADSIDSIDSIHLHSTLIIANHHCPCHHCMTFRSQGPSAII
jgi:hypothetical protein